jgi:hypothetical protein
MALVTTPWQCASDQLPVVTLDAANEPAQMIDDGIVSSARRGHVLGSRRATSGATQIQARQSPASEPRHERLTGPLTADLILHSHTLRGMRSSEHQHNKLLAAHVFSPSCQNSGVVAQPLAQIVVEIPVRDSAVEGGAGGGKSIKYKKATAWPTVAELDCSRRIGKTTVRVVPASAPMVCSADATPLLHTA